MLNKAVGLELADLRRAIRKARRRYAKAPAAPRRQSPPSCDNPRPKAGKKGKVSHVGP